MQKHQIIETLKSIYPEDQLLEISIDLNKHNHQPDKITIIFNPEFNPLSLLGHFLDKFEDLILNDNYGDLTECTIQYSTFHELPNKDLTSKLILLPNIDS